MTDRVFQAQEPNPFLAGTAVERAQRELLEKHGTPSQLERYYVGLLPDDELCALARTVLFAPFRDFKRWNKLTPADVRHEKGCPHGAITFITRPAPDLNAEEWAMYKKVRDVLSCGTLFAALNDKDVRCYVDIVEHVGLCSTCPAETIGRSASVRIEWAGRQFSREYGLEAM